MVVYPGSHGDPGYTTRVHHHRLLPLMYAHPLRSARGGAWGSGPRSGLPQGTLGMPRDEACPGRGDVLGPGYPVPGRAPDGCLDSARV